MLPQTTLSCYNTQVNAATTYLKQVREELSKVEWPDRNEAIKLTLTVVVITLIVGGFVGVLDFVFARLLETILSA